MTPDYFDVLRLPLIRGRAFSDQDQALEYLRSGTGRRRGVAIVNRAAVRQFWPREDALGRSLTIEGDWRVEGRTVVGIAGNARDLAPDLEPTPTVYIPFAESPDFGATLLVRVTEDVPPVADIRARLRSIDSLLMIGEIRRLEDSYAAALAPRRFTTVVLIAFAGVGLLLAGMGLYGVIAISVAQRTGEMGIRMALGARARHVLTLVIRQGIAPALLGLVLGVASALALTRAMSSLLYAVTPTDPVTFICISFLLIVVASLACYIPARRATKVDPLVALRYE